MRQSTRFPRGDRRTSAAYRDWKNSDLFRIICLRASLRGLGWRPALEYNLTYHDGFFEGTTSGDAEADQFGELLDLMLAHAEWKPGTPYLHDHTDLNAGPLTVDDVGRVAQLCADRRADLGAGKCALIMVRDLEFGLARMWGSLVEDKWDVEANIFRTREEAIAWLMG